MQKLDTKGFTLIELMITVAIVGILTAVAIPNFNKHRLKSRAGEAAINLAAISMAEIAFRAENNVFQACGASPAGAPSNQLRLWVTNAGYDAIGFAPKNTSVLFTYSVAVAGLTFRGTAVGDLDIDGAQSLYDVTQAQGVVRVTGTDIF